MTVDRAILDLVSRYWKEGYEMAAKRQRQWKWGLRVVDFIAYAMVCNFIYCVLVSHSWEASLVSFNFICICIFTIQFIGNSAVALWRRHLSRIRKIGALVGFTLGITMTLHKSVGAMLGLSIVGAFLGTLCSVAVVLLVIILAACSESATRIGTPIAYPIKWFVKKIMLRRVTVLNLSRGWVAGGIPGQFSLNSHSVQSIFTDNQIHQNSHQGRFRHRQRPGNNRRGLGTAGFMSLTALTDDNFSFDTATDLQNSPETGSPSGLDTQIAFAPIFEACDVAPSIPWVNPSTGLPMLHDLPGGIDVGGNLWGESDNYDHHWSDTSISNGFDDSHSHNNDYEMGHDSLGWSESTSFDEI